MLMQTGTFPGVVWKGPRNLLRSRETGQWVTVKRCKWLGSVTWEKHSSELQSPHLHTGTAHVGVARRWQLISAAGGRGLTLGGSNKQPVMLDVAALCPRGFPQALCRCLGPGEPGKRQPQRDCLEVQY